MNSDDQPVFTKKQKTDAKSHKYNLRGDADMYQLNQIKASSEQYINRNRLFYCTHQNRKNAFFNKHVLNSKTTSPQDLALKIFDEQFGFVRIRRSLRESVTRLIQTVIVNQKKFDYNYYLPKNAPLPLNWETRK